MIVLGIGHSLWWRALAILAFPQFKLAQFHTTQSYVCYDHPFCQEMLWPPAFCFFLLLAPASFYIFWIVYILSQQTDMFLRCFSNVFDMTKNLPTPNKYISSHFPFCCHFPNILNSQTCWNCFDKPVTVNGFVCKLIINHQNVQKDLRRSCPMTNAKVRKKNIFKRSPACKS